MVLDLFEWDIASLGISATITLTSAEEVDGKKMGPYLNGIHCCHFRVYDPLAAETSQTAGFDWVVEMFEGGVKGSGGLPGNIGMTELGDDEPMNQGSYAAAYATNKVCGGPFNELQLLVRNDGTAKTNLKVKGYVWRP
jgi:hypothetical protein